MDIVFVTSNSHKFHEVKPIAESYGIRLHWKSLEYFEPQASTLQDVALGSLGILSPIIQGDFLLEDAGLTINALNGFPGPYSSFVFKTIGWQGILDLMKNKKDRTAYFEAIVVGRINGEVKISRGRVKGEISQDARGTRGFGFDPIFIPAGYDKTYAELSTTEKTTISHRGKAFNDFFQKVL